MAKRLQEHDGRTIDEINCQIVECLKYLALVGMTPGRRIAVVPGVDDVWHELIVQTEPYQALCEALPGAAFIHHESITPVEYAERVGDQEFVTEFLKWIPEYVHNFGPFTDETARLWTVTQFLCDHLGMSIQDINQFGANENGDAMLAPESPWRKLGDIETFSN